MRQKGGEKSSCDSGINGAIVRVMNERTNERMKVRVDARELRDLITRVVQAEAILRRVKCDSESLHHHNLGGFRTVEVTEDTALECAGFLDKAFTTDDVQRLFHSEAA